MVANQCEFGDAKNEIPKNYVSEPVTLISGGTVAAEHSQDVDRTPHTHLTGALGSTLFLAKKLCFR